MTTANTYIHTHKSPTSTCSLSTHSDPLSSSVYFTSSILSSKGPKETSNQGSNGQRQLVPDKPDLFPGSLLLPTILTFINLVSLSPGLMSRNFYCTRQEPGGIPTVKRSRIMLVQGQVPRGEMVQHHSQKSGNKWFMGQFPESNATEDLSHIYLMSVSTLTKQTSADEFLTCLQESTI